MGIYSNTQSLLLQVIGSPLLGQTWNKGSAQAIYEKSGL